MPQGSNTLRMCTRCGQKPMREGFTICAECVEILFPPQPVPPSIQREISRLFTSTVKKSRKRG